MKKTFLVAATSLLTLQGANANDFFVGLDLGKTSMKIDSDKHLHDGTYNSSPSLGFRAGFINEDYRAYGLLSNGFYNEKDNDFAEEEIRYAQLTANVDFFFPVHEKVKLFAGPHIGWGFATVDVDTKISSSDSDTASGIAYGGQLGGIFDITKNFNIEAGYSHSWTTIDEDLDYLHRRDFGGNYADVERDIKIDQVSRFYVAANYTF